MVEKAKKGELVEVSKPVAKPATKRRRWDQVGEETPGATPGATPKKRASTWEQAEVNI